MEYQIRDIVGFPGYRIDTDGRVWSNKNRWGKKAWHEIKPNKQNYATASFYRNGREVTKTIHGLVLETFDRVRPLNMEVCHNNGIKTDNRLENLRWDTHKNNKADQLKHGTDVRGERNGFSVLNLPQVRVIKHLLFTIKSGMTQSQIAKIFNVSANTICAIKSGRNWDYVSV